MHSLENVLNALNSELLSEAILKLELFAKQKELEELHQWAFRELNGYTDKAPSYREITIVYEDYDGNVTGETRRHLKESVIKLEDAQQEGLIQSNDEVLKSKLGQTLFSRTVIKAQEVQRVLKQIRAQALRLINDHFPTASLEYTPCLCPEFSTLVSDSDLAKTLTNLWDEANRTFQAKAYLATVILQGSILEGVLSFIVQENCAEAGRSNRSPKDKRGQVLPHNEWTLEALIQVTHERSWLPYNTYKLSQNLQDFRNMVHPRKQMENQFQANKYTCEIAWNVIGSAIDALQTTLHDRSNTSIST